LARYLADAVDSALKQTYQGPIGIIILDDGSTDETLQVASRLAERESRIEVQTQTNRGRAVTRDRLVELAPTEMLAWLDADDLASPSWIDDQVDFLLHHPACVAVSGQGYSMTGTRRAIGPMDHPLDGEEIDRRHINGQANAFFQSCVLVRKSAVVSAGGYDTRYPCAEDYSLWLRLAEIGTLANLDCVHLLYRVHPTSANWTVNVDQRRQGYQIMNEARQRRGLLPLQEARQEIPPAKKDDWNRRLYWINIALKSGNPLSALEMLGVAIRKHPTSVVMWLAAAVSVCDTILFLGNKTSNFRPGKPARIGTLPRFSCYRLGRSLNRLRRRFLSPAAPSSTDHVASDS
jgi:cellulose synthase/poly-beta-1,6-N-acetylglucosamine synthase-like glycosyltransferase